MKRRPVKKHNPTPAQWLAVDWSVCPKVIAHGLNVALGTVYRQKRKAAQRPHQPLDGSAHMNNKC